MGTADFAQFVKLCVIGSLLAFGLATIVSPPDPFIGLLYFIALLPVVIVISYLFS